MGFLNNNKRLYLTILLAVVIDMQRLNAAENLATLHVVWPALSGRLYLLHNQIL